MWMETVYFSTGLVLNFVVEEHSKKPTGDHILGLTPLTVDWKTFSY